MASGYYYYEYGGGGGDGNGSAYDDDQWYGDGDTVYDGERGMAAGGAGRLQDDNISGKRRHTREQSGGKRTHFRLGLASGWISKKYPYLNTYM